MATSAPRYTERLWPSWWVWLIAACVAAGTSLIVAPVSAAAAVIVPVVVAILFLWWLVSLATRIEVTDGEVIVGKAHIDKRFVGGAEAFTGRDAVMARGIKLDARAYLHIRGWIPDVVKITIDDDSDPTPYWLVSTRDPAGLTKALG
ncbi:DUF3093 domain-containing protein [Spelaeicoccus albus]|uniref:DUF3093 family protein n=1 Tax=Spelaeicoccus albus TaxID=1280376 RepID=A0A7Z0D3I0_9MICO|nr:DUF3093 domain-containing protein [Spelaeicoccus albus]NYI68161.1 hypothetical protein [Spelaeicoccus albus]